MLPTLQRGISHRYVRSSLLRSLNAHHQRSLSAEDALEQSKAVLGWIQQAFPTRRIALQTVRRYVKDEVPLAYLLGTQPFCNLELKVRPPVLIPRPETEEWTTSLANVLRESLKQDSSFQILDLCSGSGCVGLALADHLKSTTGVRVVGVDVDPQAVALAKENAEVHQLQGLCKYEQGDLFDNAYMHNLIERYGNFDLVACNPPYIPRAEYDVLERSVREYEDSKALLGEAPSSIHQYNAKDGLAFYRRISELLHRLVNTGTSRVKDIPLLVLEVGQGQASDVAAMFAGDGPVCSVMKDFSRIERSVWVYQKA